MKIKFSQEEITEAISLAIARHEAKNNFIKNKHVLGAFKESSLESLFSDKRHKHHFIGILGEMAYAKYTNQQIDKNIYALRDTGADVGEVEVKTSTWMGDDVELKVTKAHFESKKPKKYVLVRIDENNYTEAELLGEITRNKFSRVKKEKCYGINKYNGSLLPMNYIVGLKHLSKYE
jgi:hypothetical protein